MSVSITNETSYLAIGYPFIKLYTLIEVLSHTPIRIPISIYDIDRGKSSIFYPFFGRGRDSLLHM